MSLFDVAMGPKKACLKPVWALRTLGGVKQARRTRTRPGRSKTGPQRPQTGPRRYQTGPGRSQTGLGRPQTDFGKPHTDPEKPQTSHERPQTGPVRLQTGHERPRWPQRSLGGRGGRKKGHGKQKNWPVWFHRSLIFLGLLPKNRQSDPNRRCLYSMCEYMISF